MGDSQPVDVTGRPVALRPVDLERFFRPRSVAVVGASDTPRRPNTAMFAKIKRWAEVQGATVHAVNPNRDTIDGQPCHPTLADVPGDIDVAAILVGNALEALEEAIERKVRFAVVFAAGFAEVGGEGVAAQDRLEALVAGSDVRVLGPNTNLNAFELFDDLPGPAIALITQSGHQGRPIFQAQQLGVALSHWAPTGNEADLEFADFAAWFAERPEVGVIAAYIEGFKDGRTLQLAADRAARAGTPLVVVKVGRTDEGRSMAMSHTGHLTGRDDVISAVFRQFGVIRVDGLDELQDTAAMLARAKPPQGDGGVCVYAISGGTGAHMADMAAAAGLHLPELEPATQQALHQWIPTYLRVSNPVDNGGAPSADERGRKILDAIVADPNVDVVICPITGALESLSAPLARDLVAVQETTDKPICVIWGSPLGNESVYWDILVPSRVPLFRTFGNCVKAVRAYLDHHRFRARYRSPFERPQLRPSPAAATARRRLATHPGALAEHEAKALLADYGIPVTREEVVTSAAAAARAASRFGAPVVMKVVSAGIAHKSDLDLVRLGVDGPAAARRAYTELVERAASVAPYAAVEGVLVAEMVTGGVECVVGVTHDPLFGPTVMFGLGGIHLEVMGDVTFRVPPFDRAEARRMVDEIRGRALLAGVRGQPPADVAALTDTLVRVQRLALDLHADLAELDVNPLLVRPRGQGVVALDALAVARPRMDVA